MDSRTSELGTDHAEPAYSVQGFGYDLDLLFAALETLETFDADRRQAGEDGLIYDFSIRWGTLVRGRWERLTYYYRRSELKTAEQERYEQLRDGLRRAAPVLDRLGLVKPSDTTQSAR